MHSTENEVKAVVIERFNRKIKTKIWKQYKAILLFRDCA